MDRWINSFVIWNWLTQSWRLRGPKICSWQAEDPGEPTYSPSLSPKVSRSKTQKEPVFQSDLKVRKDPCPSSTVRQEDSLLLGLLVLFRSSNDCTRTTHIRREMCFFQSTHSNINLTLEHPNRHTQDSVCSE